jgi:signal recognition particle GTPase
MQLLIRILIILLIPPLCYAEIYKWTDENGGVHYGERPSNPNSEKIEIKSSTSQPDEGLEKHREKQQKLLQSYEDERAEKKQQKAEDEKAKRKLKKNCAYLKDHYKTLKQTNIYYDIDEDGNRIYLDESILKKDIAEAEELIRKYCK